MDVPVEVTVPASPPRPRETSRRQLREEHNITLQGEAAPQFMDVDETFWVEESVIPVGEKRVRQIECSFLANLTYFPVREDIYRRIYLQDWSLLTLPTGI